MPAIGQWAADGWTATTGLIQPRGRRFPTFRSVYGKNRSNAGMTGGVAHIRKVFVASIFLP